MVNYLIKILSDYQVAITLIISISGFFLSLYNLFKDKRKITLSYFLVKHDKSNRMILTGVIANPSKMPNSIIECTYLYNGNKIDCSHYHDNGFDMGSFHKSSLLSPIPLAQEISPGYSVAFSEVLKMKDILPGEKLVMVIRTANYQKKFKLKLKDSF